MKSTFTILLLAFCAFLIGCTPAEQSTSGVKATAG